jgi:hypothetical protein
MWITKFNNYYSWINITVEKKIIYVAFCSYDVTCTIPFRDETQPLKIFHHFHVHKSTLLLEMFHGNHLPFCGPITISQSVYRHCCQLHWDKISGSKTLKDQQKLCRRYSVSPSLTSFLFLSFLHAHPNHEWMCWDVKVNWYEKINLGPSDTWHPTNGTSFTSKIIKTNITY